MRRLSLYIVLVFLMACKETPSGSSQQPDKTCYYQPAVSTISGTIERQQVYGPPGYGKSPEQDRKDSIYVIKTEQGINVLPDTATKYAANDIVEKEFGIQHFQLSGIANNDAEKYVDHKVSVTGTFYHGISGEHRTKVLMAVKEIALTPRDK